jgi:hypothetical protein
LLVVIPAGLLLGAVGGHYARPVLQQRADDAELQRIFQSATKRRDAQVPAAPTLSHAAPQTGGIPYIPASTDDRTMTGWQGPDFAEWPEYTPAPMPTIEELQAELARRDAALGEAASSPEGDGAVVAAADAQLTANDAKAAAVSGRARAVPAPGPEPRTAGGTLPAIW